MLDGLLLSLSKLIIKLLITSKFNCIFVLPNPYLKHFVEQIKMGAIILVKSKSICPN